MKAWLKYGILLLACVVGLFMLDYALVFFFHTNPVFSVKEIQGESEVYTAFWYKVWKCRNNGVTTFHIGNIDEKYVCPVKPVPMRFYIIDESTSCNSAMELLYENNLYQYYLPCTKSHQLYIVFSNEDKILLKDALEANMVTMDEIKEQELLYFKEPKFSLQIKKSNTVCKTEKLFESVLTETPFTIYTNCLEEVILTIDGAEISLLDALRKEKITMDDIVYAMEFGYHYAEGNRQIYHDGGTVLYHNFSYALLKCNTITGNRDYYIGSPDMKYEDAFCK